MSSPPTGNVKTVANGMEGNGTTQRSSAETTLVEIPPAESDVEYTKNGYNRDYLARSLGLETAFSSILDASFVPQPMSESPLDLNKTRIRWSKTEEADAASWTRLVVEGTESSLFDGVSTAESDMHLHTELVSWM